MCTVTIVPNTAKPGAFRMACSRDESHGRDAAHPPRRRDFAGYATLMPTDPKSDGTWVGVNSRGLALTLLNYNLPKPPTDRDVSRGDVIPQLLGATRVSEVVDRLGDVDRTRMMPFRLVACDGDELLLWRSTESPERVEVESWDGRPMMYTSSGLGDHLVEGPRRELFDGWFGTDPAAYLDRQQAFHRHQWPGREHVSVCMHRDDARTVSYTLVDVEPASVAMTYHPDRPDRDAKPAVASLSRS